MTTGGDPSDRTAQAVVLDDEAVQALERVVLAGDLAHAGGRRRADRLLEQRQQQLVLAPEVLVEAAQRLAGALDDLLHGEVLARAGVHQLNGGVEEALDAALGPDAGQSPTSGPPPAPAN